jgi:hypothetical protein
MIKFTADFSGLEQHLEDYIEELQATLASALPEIAVMCAAEIAARAPDPELEEAITMYGEPGSAPPDTTDRARKPGARNRYFKGDFLYIQQAILQSFIVEDDTIFLGLVDQLNETTQFKWTNANGNTESSGYGMWEFFELGKRNTVTPRGDWFLSVTDQHRVATYDKQYPAMGMYALFNPLIFQEALIDRLRTVQF